jgi:ketosteroid isomerase-like protein
MATAEEDRNKLRVIQGVFEDAVKNNAIENMRPYVDPDFSFVSFTDRSFTDFDSFVSQWEQTRKHLVGAGRFETELNPEPTNFIDNLALCRGNAVNRLTDRHGKVYDFTTHWTVVFRRYGNDWKVLRAHNSLDPFRNPMVVHSVKKKLVKYAAIAFILGLGTCLLVMELISF